jgi:hypothetical protein
MKKTMITILCIICLNHVYGVETNDNSRIKFTTIFGEPVDVCISSKAYELVEYYNRSGEKKIGNTTMPPSRVWLSPELNSEHLAPEYRKAWEELLPYWVAHSTRQVNRIRPRIENYFYQSKSPESIPALLKAFKQTVDIQNSISYISLRQKFLLEMFLRIRTEESFDALVKSLNLLEKTYSNTPSPEDSIYNEHPWAYYKKFMLQQDRKPVADHDITWLGYTKEWQAMAANYDSSDLLPKTKKFVEELASYRHPYIDYSDNPVFGTNEIEVVAETNTIEQVIETEVITNLVVETVSPVIEIITNDIEKIILIEEEPISKDKTLLVIIIAIASIILGIVIAARKSS